MTLRAKGQITLPEAIRSAAHLEDGDLLDAELTEDGILLRPRKVIDATQAWFWSPDWQRGEQAVEVDRRADRIETFASGDEMIEELRSIARADPGVSSD